MPSIQESIGMFQRGVEKITMNAKEQAEIADQIRLGLQVMQAMTQRIQQLEAALKAAGVPLPGEAPAPNVMPFEQPQG